MKKLLINIQPTLFNYSGYIIDNDIVKETSVIPVTPFNITTFALEQKIDTIILKGPSNYVQGIKEQLETKINIPIEIYEEK